MDKVISRDGTIIAYERPGAGPPVILVVGALNDRSTGAPLAALLATRFTVFTYDRRGRGDSGDTAPYAVDREIEDLDALVREAGGSAYVFGYSSGAILALAAAARGLAIEKLALYEPPFMVTEDRPRPSAGTTARLAALVGAGRREEAAAFFQTEVVGIPATVVAKWRRAPSWPALAGMAHTLVYELAIVGDRSLPASLAAVTAPTLVLAGERSPAELRLAARAVAEALPRARHQCLADQSHDIVAPAVAPVLADFLLADA
ncbi:MAG TPA: alpha/beta hydrolase [Pilimelia sp.]|nr:alpha/beta hydrolase [Pilimelia sp.]